MISLWLNHFHTLWNKTKKHGNTISVNSLAVKLIWGAMLTETQQEVIQAAGLNMTYDVVKATMLRMFGESTGLNSTKIKTEPTFHQTKHLSNCSGGACNCNKLMGHHSSSESTSDEETYYGRNKRYWKKKDNRNYREKSDTENYNKFRKSKGRNPLDSQGKITRCNICESVNHWASKCPDRDRREEENLYSIILFESDLEQTYTSIVQETLGAAVIDCGASKTVCGREWFESYIDMLPEDDKKSITQVEGGSSYKFGVGKTYKAFKSCRIPIKIGKIKAYLETDVIDHDLPLLFSRSSMKKAKGQLDTVNDEITLLGCTVKLISTKSGHYAIPLLPQINLMNLCQDVHFCGRVEFVLKTINMSKIDMAQKLHRQFAHPPVEKLLKLIRLSEHKDDLDLQQEVKNVTDKCITCMRYKKAPPRPVVGMPLASKFN